MAILCYPQQTLKTYQPLTKWFCSTALKQSINERVTAALETINQNDMVMFNQNYKRVTAALKT